MRDAADRDYRIVVLADGCADFDAEVHEVLLGMGDSPRSTCHATETCNGGAFSAPR